MISQTFAAAFAAALGIGSMLAPVESAARGGAISIGHHGGFHPFVRPFHHPMHPRFGHFGHVPPSASSRALVARIHARNVGLLRHHRRPLGFGLPLTVVGDAAFYGAYYDPSDYVQTYDQPVYGGPRGGAAVVLNRGCRSEDVIVPSSKGGERTVTITRC